MTTVYDRPMKVQLICPACGADVLMPVMSRFNVQGPEPDAQLHLRVTALESENARLRKLIIELLRLV